MVASSSSQINILDWFSSSEMLRIFVYSRGVDRFLREIGPDVIILPELNVGTLSTIFVAKGKRNRVPAVVVPFAIPNPTEPAAYYGNDPLHRADRPLGRVLGRLYPQWRFEHEGKKRLRLPPLVASILKILGFSTRATWILNRGDAAAIALDSEAQRDFYLHPGFPRDQLKVTGDLNYCVPFAMKQELVDELCRRRGLQPGLPLLVCGFRPTNIAAQTPETLSSQATHP